MTITPIIMSSSAPKQWSLTSDETLSSFEAWKDNLLFRLEENNDHNEFLKADASWKKKSEDADRGITGENKDKRVRILERMLGQIANFAPLYNRNDIVKNSISLDDIWNKLKTHYQLQTTGATILGLVDFKIKTGEKHEDLYQRLVTFIEGNLLTKSGIKHEGKALATDESLTPTLQNILTVLWLQMIHPGLPHIVGQKYGAELRDHTLASLKPQISVAMSSLLSELQSIDE